MSTTARLTATGTTTLGTLVLEVDLTVAAGEVVALVGPNGSGKSSTLDAVLGWLTLDGSVTVDGTEVGGRAPSARGLGWAPQRPGVPPHARVDRLLARAADGDAERVADLRERLLLADLPRRAGACSGGQAQRLAVARALLASPIVLLDEPRAAQDARGAVAVASAVREVAASGGAVLLVAHRPDDVDGLADRVVVLEEGRVAQRGTLREVRSAPRTAHAARVLGTTVLQGQVDEKAVLRGPWGSLRVADGTPSGPATALIRPAAVALSAAEPTSTSQRNVRPVVVDAVRRHAEGVTVSLGGEPELRALVTADAAAALDLQPGARLWASIKAVDIELR